MEWRRRTEGDETILAVETGSNAVVKTWPANTELLMDFLNDMVGLDPTAGLDPAVQARLDGMARALAAHGTNAVVAKQQALAILERQIGAQASVLAFSKIYLLNGILLVCALPLLLFWRTGRGRGSGATAH